jgi:hypothetical protein
MTEQDEDKEILELLSRVQLVGRNGQPISEEVKVSSPEYRRFVSLVGFYQNEVASDLHRAFPGRDYQISITIDKFS